MPHAQEIGDLDALLDRLGRYLLSYEPQLTTLIADEQYEQMELRAIGRPPGRSVGTAPINVARKRQMQSDVAFLRLPGGSIWFGVRDVQTVDGKPVMSDTPRLQELLKRLDTSGLERAATIVARSAQYNLGPIRTINMPTVPLEVLHPDHHVQFAFKVRGGNKVEGVQTQRLDFEEFDEPTLVSTPDGEPVAIRGTGWSQTPAGCGVSNLRFDPNPTRVRRSRSRAPCVWVSCCIAI